MSFLNTICRVQYQLIIIFMMCMILAMNTFI